MLSSDSVVERLNAWTVDGLSPEQVYQAGYHSSRKKTRSCLHVSSLKRNRVSYGALLTSDKVPK